MLRDHAFPFSSYLAEVHPKLQIPLRAMAVVFGIEIIIGKHCSKDSPPLQLSILFAGFVIFGGDLAFEAIISGAGVSLQFGYMVPVALVGHTVLLRRLRWQSRLLKATKVLYQGRSKLPPKRSFSLGKLGYVANALSICWSVLVIIVFV